VGESEMLISEVYILLLGNQKVSSSKKNEGEDSGFEKGGGGERMALKGTEIYARAHNLTYSSLKSTQLFDRKQGAMAGSGKSEREKRQESGFCKKTPIFGRKTMRGRGYKKFKCHTTCVIERKMKGEGEKEKKNLRFGGNKVFDASREEPDEERKNISASQKKRVYAEVQRREKGGTGG